MVEINKLQAVIDYCKSRMTTVKKRSALYKSLADVHSAAKSDLIVIVKRKTLKKNTVSLLQWVNQSAYKTFPPFKPVESVQATQYFKKFFSKHKLTVEAAIAVKVKMTQCGWTELKIAQLLIEISKE